MGNRVSCQWEIEFLAGGNQISEDFIKLVLLLFGERGVLETFFKLPNHLKGLVGKKMKNSAVGKSWYEGINRG